jgi:hypothetical protein
VKPRRAQPLARLVDANPEIIDGVLIFDCPVHNECSRVQVRIRAHPNAQEPWQVEGDTFADMTLSPSIAVRYPRECGWHGFVRSGRFETCGDLR